MAEDPMTPEERREFDRRRAPGWHGVDDVMSGLRQPAGASASARERRNRRVEQAGRNAAAMNRLMQGAGRGYRGSVIRANAPAPAPAPAPKPAPLPPQKVEVTHREGVKPIQERGPLPGAANGVFVLGFGLAAVALWKPVVGPLLGRAWKGSAYDTSSAAPPAIPSSGTISLVLFILFLVFLSSLSPDMAQLVFLLMLGLWAVFLVMNPSALQSLFSWMSQGNTQIRQRTFQTATTGTPPGPLTQGGGGSHVK